MFIDQVNKVSIADSIKVLIVDDSNTIRRSAELLLSDSGYKVITATDGFDAMSKIVDNQPDIIFMDIVMPKVDGYHACQMIKKNHRFLTTPVIMLSSKDGIFDKVKGRMAGSDEYLTKPFTKEVLLATIQKHALRLNNK